MSKKANTQSEFTDDWRYVYCDDWKIDKLSSHETEDDVVAQLDAHYNPLPDSQELNAVNLLDDVLSERHAKIVYWYLWEGLTFAEIAERLGVNRARAHVLYKNALKHLKTHINKTTTSGD